MLSLVSSSRGANRLEFGLGAGAGPIPVVLGGLFSFVSAIHIQPFDGEGDASIAGEIQFFEADGTTPVPITDATVPEPGSFLLLGLGGVAMLVWKTRSRRGA